MEQATRKITYGSISSMSGAQEIFSNAKTWGELKRSEAAISAAASGMSALIGGSNTKLTSESQPLPVDDFTLYFVLEKNNSGNGND